MSELFRWAFTIPAVCLNTAGTILCDLAQTIDDFYAYFLEQ